MLRLESNRGVRSCDGLTRRDFLRVGSLAVGLSLTELAELRQLGAAPGSGEKACIQLFLVGGPSQLDTWDPKPYAPEHIRGPFRPIQTNVPGMQICEHFTRMAKRADRYAILRSVCHQEAPIHETGHQLMQTGHLSHGGIEWPHYGAVLTKLRPPSGPLPPWIVLPGPIEDTGVGISHGQTGGFLGKEYGPCCFGAEETSSFLTAREENTSHDLDPARLGRRTALVEAVDAAQAALEGSAVTAQGCTGLQQAWAHAFGPQAKKAFDIAAEPEVVRDRYGWNTFGQSCLLARRLVEHGVKLVTVNMFDTVFNQITWDCHANGGDLNTTLDDYKETLCPMFDAAYSALLDDLQALGLLENTLVVAMGEFGRTPKLNSGNGRDHWPGVWSVLMAGGGVQGGRVIGASDKHGEEPKDRPVHPSEIAATVYHALGIDGKIRLQTTDDRWLPLVEAEPVGELFF